VSDEQALPVRIRVLEGELTQQVMMSGQPAGVVVLAAQALPYQGVSYETTQRLKTTWNAGGGEATQQVMGPSLSPTVMQGWWKDAKLGARAARALADLLDDVCQRGVELEVAWGDGVDGDAQLGAGGAIVRRGRMARFKATWDRPQDARWEVEFAWRGRGQAAGRAAAIVDVASAHQGFADAVAALDDASEEARGFLDRVAAVGFGIADPAFDAMNTALAGLETATESIDLANGLVGFTVGIPTWIAQQVMAASTLALTSLADLVTTVTSINVTDLVPVDDALQMVLAFDQVLQLLGLASVAAEAAAGARDAAAARVEPDVVAEVDAVPGTDLRDLAARFYGDPDSWWTIAEFNGIDGSAVPAPPSGPSDAPARPIQIPRLDPGPASNLRAAC
jgi:hypothetical protein